MNAIELLEILDETPKPVLIVAISHEYCKSAARFWGLKPKDYIYIHKPEQLMGVAKGTPLFVTRYSSNKANVHDLQRMSFERELKVHYLY